MYLLTVIYSFRKVRNIHLPFVLLGVRWEGSKYSPERGVKTGPGRLTGTKGRILRPKREGEIPDTSMVSRDSQFRTEKGREVRS